MNFLRFLVFFKVLKERYNDFNKHPLIESATIGIIKYVFINIILRVKKKPLIIDWINNLKYYLSIGDSSMITNYYYVLQDYEESMFMINYLDKNDLFVDVSSNHGHYTLLCSKITKADVISIEPVKTTCEKLRKIFY